MSDIRDTRRKLRQCGLSLSPPLQQNPMILFVFLKEMAGEAQLAFTDHQATQGTF